MLIVNVDCDSSGNVKIILTDDGQKMRKLYELSGLDFSDLLQRKLKAGINKQFSHYVVINDSVIQGQFKL
jgi:hypothetical protein